MTCQGHTPVVTGGRSLKCGPVQGPWQPRSERTLAVSGCWTGAHRRWDTLGQKERAHTMNTQRQTPVPGTRSTPLARQGSHAPES